MGRKSIFGRSPARDEKDDVMQNIFMDRRAISIMSAILMSGVAGREANFRDELDFSVKAAVEIFDRVDIELRDFRSPREEEK